VLIATGFQVEFHSRARTILGTDFPFAVGELEASLSEATISIKEIITGGVPRLKACNVREELSQPRRGAGIQAPFPDRAPDSIAIFHEGKAALDEVQAAEDENGESALVEQGAGLNS
jgi:hypothetical protein